MPDNKKKKSLKIILGFIGGIIIIALVVAFIIFALRFVKQKELEYSVLVADYCFYLRDNDLCDKTGYLNEEDFLKYCTDTKIREIVEEYYEFYQIIYVGNEVVIIIMEKPVVLPHQGYAIVRNNAELPNAETQEPYTSAKFEVINDRVYSFSWSNLTE